MFRVWAPDRYPVRGVGKNNCTHLAAPDLGSALLPAPHAARLHPFFLQIETLRDDLLSYGYVRQLMREKKRSLMPSDERKL
jgi:hypothetical protein